MSTSIDYLLKMVFSSFMENSQRSALGPCSVLFIQLLSVSYILINIDNFAFGHIFFTVAIYTETVILVIYQSHLGRQKWNPNWEEKIWNKFALAQNLNPGVMGSIQGHTLSMHQHLELTASKWIEHCDLYPNCTLFFKKNGWSFCKFCLFWTPTSASLSKKGHNSTCG